MGSETMEADANPLVGAPVVPQAAKINGYDAKTLSPSSRIPGAQSSSGRVPASGRPAARGGAHRAPAATTGVNHPVHTATNPARATGWPYTGSSASCLTFVT